MKIKEKEIKELRGVEEGVIPVIIEKVKIKIEKKEMNIRIAFALIEEFPPLLGGLDIFDKFEIIFRENKGEVEFRS